LQVILREKIYRLGDIGDEVRVRPGYARNYLFPKGKAVPATRENLAQVERERERLAKEQATALAAAREREAVLAQAAITVHARSGLEGKLHGSVGPAEIAEAATQAGIELARSEVQLPEGHISTQGEHQIKVLLHPDLRVPVRVVVVSESSESPRESETLEREEAPEGEEAPGKEKEAQTAENETPPEAS